MQVKELPSPIHFWLRDRCISDEIIRGAKLGWEDGKLVIPVFDINGEFLFNKYRKDPREINDEPKYTYSAGASSALYGIESIKDKSSIVYICEGELDTLVLRSLGLNAVSSTGGSGTFKESWSDLLGSRNFYICYDYDQAGIKGAMKVHLLLSGSSVIWLPRSGQDVTSYFQRGKELIHFCKLERNQYPFPNFEDVDSEKPEWLKEQKKRIIEVMNKINEVERPSRNKKGYAHEHIEYIISLYENNKRLIERKLKQKEKQSNNKNLDNFADEIQRAKETPIDFYVTFRQNKARCIWHDEKTASMHWYTKTNHVQCFGCGRRGDVIDVVRKKYNLELKEAVDKILHG